MRISSPARILSACGIQQLSKIGYEVIGEPSVAGYENLRLCSCGITHDANAIAEWLERKYPFGDRPLTAWLAYRS